MRRPGGRRPRPGSRSAPPPRPERMRIVKPSSRSDALDEGRAVRGVAQGRGARRHDAADARAARDRPEVAQRLEGALERLAADPPGVVELAREAQRGAAAGEDVQVAAGLRPVDHDAPRVRADVDDRDRVVTRGRRFARPSWARAYATRGHGNEPGPTESDDKPGHRRTGQTGRCFAPLEHTSRDTAARRRDALQDVAEDVLLDLSVE